MILPDNTGLMAYNFGFCGSVSVSEASTKCRSVRVWTWGPLSLENVDIELVAPVVWGDCFPGRLPIRWACEEDIVGDDYESVADGEAVSSPGER